MSVSRLGVIGICLGILAAPLAAQGDAPLVLSAAGNWTVDFADHHCAVRRSFGTGEEEVLLEFRSYLPSLTVDARLASRDLDLRVRKPTSQFRPFGEVQSHEHYRTLSADGGWRGIAYDEKLLEGEQAVGSYVVRGAFGRDVELMTGSLSEVSKVLRSCEDDLLAPLGLDAGANRSLSRRVVLTGDEKWLDVTAPMQRDLSKKGSMFQQVRLLVNEQGKVFACRVVEGSADEAISKRMCDALVREAQFQPALDAASQPVKSYYLLVLSAMRAQ